MEARLDRLGHARRWVGRQAAAVGFDEEAVAAWQLALDEALTNIIRHAYEGRGGPIRVETDFDGERMRVVVEDEGLRFDLSAYAPPDLETASIGGYGIFLMQRVLDDVAYDTSPPKGTRLTLVKRLGRSEAREKDTS